MQYLSGKDLKSPHQIISGNGGLTVRFSSANSGATGHAVWFPVGNQTPTPYITEISLKLEFVKTMSVTVEIHTADILAGSNGTLLYKFIYDRQTQGHPPQRVAILSDQKLVVGLTVTSSTQLAKCKLVINSIGVQQTILSAISKSNRDAIDSRDIESLQAISRDVHAHTENQVIHIGLLEYVLNCLLARVLPATILVSTISADYQDHQSNGSLIELNNSVQQKHEQLQNDHDELAKYKGMPVTSEGKRVFLTGLKKYLEEELAKIDGFLLELKSESESESESKELPSLLSLEKLTSQHELELETLKTRLYHAVLIEKIDSHLS